MEEPIEKEMIETDHEDENETIVNTEIHSPTPIDSILNQSTVSSNTSGMNSSNLDIVISSSSSSSEDDDDDLQEVLKGMENIFKVYPNRKFDLNEFKREFRFNFGYILKDDVLLRLLKILHISGIIKKKNDHWSYNKKFGSKEFPVEID